MRLRSLLFVPGDRPERMQKALATAADALILDLEDAVAAEKKDYARSCVAAFLAQRPVGRQVFVRVNPLDGGAAELDLAAVMPCAPDGIVLPKAEGAISLSDLDSRMNAFDSGKARILPIATETPKAIFALGSYGGVTGRLCGLTWGAEDLPAAIGASAAREVNGAFTPPYELARSLLLFGAHAAGVPAIETVYTDFANLAGLKDYAAKGRRDGFTGMLAIHPAQVPVINAAFTPSESEVIHAQRVVELFEKNPGVGALNLDGRMIDAPHLNQARKLLALAGEIQATSLTRQD